MMRQFKMYNSRMDLFDLSENKDFISVNPSGLGVLVENDYHVAGTNFVTKKRTMGLGELTLTLVLGHMKDNAYSRYTEFVEFLNHSPYVLVYEFDGREFRRDCVLSGLTKSELRMSRTLQESLKLEFTSPFYIERTERTKPFIPIEGKAGKFYEAVKPERRIFEQLPDGGYRAGDMFYWNGIVPEEQPTYPEIEGYFIATKTNTSFDFNDFQFYNTTLETQDKTYDYIYDYPYGPELYLESYDDEFYHLAEYIYDDEEGEGNSFIIDNNSVYIGLAKSSPCEITIYGPCENPHWDLIRGTEIVQSDGYNITVPEGYRLVVSSDPQRQRAQLIGIDGTVSNVYQQQDLSKTNFVTFPVGRSKIIFFNYYRGAFRYREEYVTI